MHLYLLFLLACLHISPLNEQKYVQQITGKVTLAPTVEHPKEIVVVTHAGPNTYYVNADNEYAGIEYDLAHLFESKYAPEYKVKFLVVNKVSDVMPALLSGKADIAAASLPMHALNKQQVKFSLPYHETQQLLVYNNLLNQKPKSLASITQQQLVVPANSRSSFQLAQLHAQNAPANWKEDEASNAEVLLTKVANGKLDYTVAGSQLINLMQNYYPNLQEALPIGKPEKIAWAFSPDADARLIKKVNAYFATIKKDGNLRNLLDRYYGYTERLDPSDISFFLTHIENTLPTYKALFKKAESDTGLNWRLLAALSFRESHWNPNNTSPTNVRGMMMLTENTANAMGVSDRLDPKQSIPAGAQYIVQLKEMFPESIPNPDRTYFALAAYNIGYSHVQDARTLAKRLKLNPDSWADIKKTLVLLNDPDYYTTVKNGYASGGAPVVFVETVRSYERILEKYQPSPTQLINNYLFATQ